ncbi:MAG: hypothetical protein Q9227_002009 [Pyrenula ochraceoflavens]
MQSLWLPCCLILIWLSKLSTTASDYHELLTLKPLPLGNLLASFDFQSNQSLASFENQDFRFFPRSLGQILQHAEAKELHLRFTSGRWDPEIWGSRPWDGYKEGGTGVELWAWIDANTEEQAYPKWLTLTQSLSGLFCASLNFIDSTRTFKPVESFVSNSRPKADGLHLFHGVLPGEVVCTENLTPFLKLLPCKGKAGISSLLDGHKLFDSSWQSMSIDVRRVCSSDSANCTVEISQSVDMVLNIERSKRPKDNPIPRPVPTDQLICDQSKPYHSSDACFPVDLAAEAPWSLVDVFGASISRPCPLTDEEHRPVCLVVPHDRQVFVSSNVFESKSPAGSLPESRCYHIHPEYPFDVELPSQSPIPAYALPQEPIRVERTITGFGAASGGLRTVLENPLSTNVTLVYYETLPWYMRPYLHTLQTTLSLPSTTPPMSIPTTSLIIAIYYRPALDRERGTQLELHLTLPPSSTATLTYSFEKTILRYTEYPPDANRGFNVAPAVLRVLTPPQHANTYLRTTSLLLPLPTPDFSMPYNVIILTSTVIALAFGNIFNLLVRRFVGADEVEGLGLSGLKDKVRSRFRALAERIGAKRRQKIE